MNVAARPIGAAPDLTADEFARIAAIAHRDAGLSIPEGKRSMIGARLTKRLRATGCTSVSQYLDRLATDDGATERRQLINALTTNVSHFFREMHHFDHLAREILPPLIARAKGGGRVRLWSAGCSTGQEPYSVAMTLLDLAPEAPGLDIRILATDIDDEVLSFASSAVYGERHLQGLDDARMRRFFDRSSGPSGPVYTVGDRVRALVRFRQLNLVGHWPISGPFDAILCRNVVIYFDAATQAALWPRFEQLLAPGGYLFLGHSERLAPGAPTSLHSAGVTTYRKAAAPDPNRRQHGKEA